MHHKIRCSVMAGGFLLVGLICLLSFSAFAQEFTGKTVNVAYFANHRQIAPAWAVMGEFEKRTGMKVNVVGQPTVLDVVAAMTRDVVLGTNEYDVYETGMIEIAGVADFMASLDELIIADGMDPEELKKRYGAGSIADFTFDGVLKGIPYYTGTISGAYRRNLFEDPKEKADFKRKYGYDLRPPTTWKEFVDTAQFFTRDTDKNGDIDLWGVIIPGKGDSGRHIFLARTARAGLAIQDEHGWCLWGPRHPENHEMVRQIAQDLVDLLGKWKVVPSAITAMQTGEVKDFYKSGRAAMVMDMIYYMWDDITSPEIESRIGPVGEFRFPFVEGHPNDGIMIFNWGWTINAESKVKQATWEFLKWIAVDEDMLKLYMEEGTGTFIPSNLKVAKWAVDRRLIPGAGAAEVAMGREYWYHAAISEVFHGVLEEYFDLLMTEKITAEEFVTRTGRKADEIMIKRGLIR